MDVFGDHRRRWVDLEVLVLLDLIGARERADVPAGQVAGIGEVEVAGNCEDPIVGVREPIPPHAFDGGEIEPGQLVGGGDDPEPRLAAVSGIGVRNVFGQVRVAGRIVDVRLQRALGRLECNLVEARSGDVEVHELEDQFEIIGRRCADEVLAGLADRRVQLDRRVGQHGVELDGVELPDPARCHDRHSVECLGNVSIGDERQPARAGRREGHVVVSDRCRIEHHPRAVGERQHGRSHERVVALEQFGGLLVHWIRGRHQLGCAGGGCLACSDLERRGVPRRGQAPEPRSARRCSSRVRQP